MLNCPRCDSPQPHLHPAVQHEGEVQICPHPFHGGTDTAASLPSVAMTDTKTSHSKTDNDEGGRGTAERIRSAAREVASKAGIGDPPKADNPKIVGVTPATTTAGSGSEVRELEPTTHGTHRRDTTGDV